MAYNKEDRLGLWKASNGNSKKIVELSDEELMKASLDIQRKFRYYQTTVWDLDCIDINIRIEAEKRGIELECMDKYAKTEEEKIFYKKTFSKRLSN
jgi:hypothetical protein